MPRGDESQGQGRPPLQPRALAGLGIELAVPIVVFLYVGYRCDVWLGTAPWLLLLGAFVGIALSFYTLFRRVAPPPGGGGGEPR